MSDIVLIHPFFLLLIPLFIFATKFWKRQKRSYLIPHFITMMENKKEQKSLDFWLKWVMIVSAIVSLSDPSLKQEEQSSKPNSRDIVLAIDTSGSMSMTGFDLQDGSQSRLDVLKDVVVDFIQHRSQDRVGLVVFGDQSAIAAPLSFEFASQKEIVKALNVGMLGKSTAIIDALVQAETLLTHSQSKSKIIILLSDGEDEMSKIPLSFALQYASKHHIKIYTILIDKSDSNLMQLIAYKSDTKAYSAKDKKALQSIYHDIDSLEKSDVVYVTTTVLKTLYMPFVFLALLAGIGLLWRGYRRGLS